MGEGGVVGGWEDVVGLDWMWGLFLFHLFAFFFYFFFHIFYSLAIVFYLFIFPFHVCEDLMAILCLFSCSERITREDE